MACTNKNVYKYYLDTSSEKPSKALNAHKNLITSMCLDRDENALLVGTSDGLIYLWSTETDELLG